MLKSWVSKIYQGLLKRKFVKNLTCFKNCHKNQRCFVIGNGPSLTTDDLDKLRNEFTFACNNIFNLYNKTSFRPTYYVSQDDAVILENLDKLLAVCKESNACFINGALYRNYPKELRQSGNVAFFHSFTESNENGENFISDDITKGINNGFTVTFAMIEIAMYMGFNRIYLLGVDNNFSTIIGKDGKMIKQAVKDHFEGGDHINIKNSGINVWDLEESYNSARKYAEAHDVQIYNATRGGKLEVFERVDFDSLFSNSEEATTI